jgi:hypothetical protein
VAQRSPEQIQAEIEAARVALAASLDQLADRTNPKRLANQGKAKALEFVKTPKGQAIVGGAGALLVLLVVLRRRSHR